jgi:hypothetical protein
MLEGIPCGTCDNPSIFMHANQGITFDIAAIQRALGEKQIMRFESICGISQLAPDYGKSDIFVLVDGKIRFHQKDIIRGQAFKISFDLTDKDQFLTLVAASSPGKELPEGARYEVGDWCLFARPVLVLN